MLMGREPGGKRSTLDVLFDEMYNAIFFARKIPP